MRYSEPRKERGRLKLLGIKLPAGVSIGLPTPGMSVKPKSLVKLSREREPWQDNIWKGGGNVKGRTGA